MNPRVDTLTLYNPLDIAWRLVSHSMSWLLKTRGTPAQKQLDGTDTVKALQKLKGFFDIAKVGATARHPCRIPYAYALHGTMQLCTIESCTSTVFPSQEALQHAVACDEQGDAQRALKLYKTALEACDEGLKLPARSVGLNPDADSVAAWRTQLCTWRDDVQDRWAGEGLWGGAVRQHAAAADAADG